MGCARLSNLTNKPMFLLTVHSDTMWQWLKNATFSDDGAGVLARVVWKDLFKDQLAFILSSGDFLPVLLPDKLHTEIREVVDACESDGVTLLCIWPSAVDRSLKVWCKEIMNTVQRLKRECDISERKCYSVLPLLQFCGSSTFEDKK